MERKEAIDVIKMNWHDSSFTILHEALETLIPELKESKNEKIRKSLIILLRHFCKGYRVPGLDFPVSYEDMLAWLEEPTTSLWHNASEKAEKGKLYLYRTNQNIVDINRSEGKEFPHYCEKWAYIDDLLKL